MDVGRAFSFVSSDPRWISKVIIGAVLILIPLIGAILILGYSMRIIRLVATGADTTLPEWDDWGGLFEDGLKAFGIYLIWSIPIYVISAPAWIASAADDSGLAAFCLSCLSIPLSLAIVTIMPAPIARVAVSGSFSAGLEVGPILQTVRANLGDFIMVLLVTIVGGIVAAFGVIACIIGVLFTTAFLYFFVGHLWGQLYRRTSGAGALPATPRF